MEVPPSSRHPIKWTLCSKKDRALVMARRFVRIAFTLVGIFVAHLIRNQRLSRKIDSHGKKTLRLAGNVPCNPQIPNYSRNSLTWRLQSSVATEIGAGETTGHRNAVTFLDSSSRCWISFNHTYIRFMLTFVHSVAMCAITLGLDLGGQLNEEYHHLRLLSHPSMQVTQSNMMEGRQAPPRHILVGSHPEHRIGSDNDASRVDYGTFTLVSQDSVGGLELENPHTKHSYLDKCRGLSRPSFF